MSTEHRPAKALVLSSIASHPQDYGNRNRILQMTRFFKELGYEIHFLFYPIEPDWSRAIPPSAREMIAEWDSFTIIPPSRPLHQPAAAEYHEIDEWWDPLIGHYLDWIFKREFYDVMLVNYTYFSKAFEHAPRGTVKVLEMHDLFSGRREMFAANGVGPDFFYTTPDREKVAFDRADIVIAIKEGEATIVRNMTRRPAAVSVPFFMPERPSQPRPERLLPEEDLRVGFLGAHNVVNVVNMRRFLERYERAHQLYLPGLTLDIAGNVCTQLQTSSPGVRLLGRVERIEDFYDNIDVVIAPLMFSTGIKIKVGEALSFGKPVVATENGFDGYTPTDKFHTLKSYEDVTRALVTLSFDRERLKVLESRSAFAAKMARQAYNDGCWALSRAVKRQSKMIVLVTDQPIWGSGTAQQERLAQWIQLFAYMGRAVVLYVGSRPIDTPIRDDMGLVKFVDLSGEEVKLDAIMGRLKQLDRTHNIVELIISTEGGFAEELWARTDGEFPYISLDMWVPVLADRAGVEQANVGSPDVYITHRNGSGERSGMPMSLNALRYEPFTLRGWVRTPHESEIWIARCGPTESEEAGIEMLLANIDEAAPVSIVDLDVFGTGTNGSLEDLKGRQPPRLVIAVGRERRAANIWRSLAQQAGIGWLYLSDSSFPVLLDNGSENPTLCASYGDVARQLAAIPDVSTFDAMHAGDTGWFTYWNVLAKR